MNDAKAQPAVLKAIIQVKRKDTGKVDEYVITGTPAHVQGQAGRIPAKKD